MVFSLFTLLALTLFLLLLLPPLTTLTLLLLLLLRLPPRFVLTLLLLQCLHLFPCSCLYCCPTTGGVQRRCEAGVAVPHGTGTRLWLFCCLVLCARCSVLCMMRSVLFALCCCFVYCVLCPVPGALYDALCALCSVPGAFAC